jgi:transcriptional regulator with XRE-family HTH domain
MEINPKALAAWRRHRGLTYRSLAERAGTSAGYVSDVERGKHRPSKAKVEALALALGVEPAALLLGSSCPTCNRTFRRPKAGAA